jgi:TfoX/Sxy family transcriptional regulator of competence genes
MPSKKKGPAMPKWRPSPPALARRFEAAVAGWAGVTVRKMFGYPAGFSRGHMFGGLFAESVVVRLSPAEREELHAAGGRRFEPMPGRPMREYVVLPSRIVESDAELGRWLERGRTYVSSLPPKSTAGAKKAAGKRPPKPTP